MGDKFTQVGRSCIKVPSEVTFHYQYVGGVTFERKETKKYPSKNNPRIRMANDHRNHPRSSPRNTTKLSIKNTQQNTNTKQQKEGVLEKSRTPSFFPPCYR